MTLSKRISFFAYVCLMAAVFVFSKAAYAANEDQAINAGASAAVQEEKIRNQAEDQLFRPKAIQPLSLEEQKPEIPESGPSFFVKKINLEGDVFLEPEEYRPFFEKIEGREVRFSEIQSLIYGLEELLRAKGYIAIVLLPPRKMENQEITLKIVISRMGDLSVENNRYFAKWRTKSYWTTRKGGILWYSKVRRDAINMNENPDRTVKPILKAGSEKGTTDVVLNVKDHFPLHAGYSFDNQGVKLTGKRRNGFTLRNNNMLGLDDIFLIGTIFGKDFGALYLYHLIPITNFGTKFIWSFSHSQVNPKKEYAIFGINGTSETYSLGVQQRLFLTEKYSGNVTVGMDFKEKHTRTQSVTTVWDRERVISLKGDFQSRDRWGGMEFGARRVLWTPYLW